MFSDAGGVSTITMTLYFILCNDAPRLRVVGITVPRASVLSSNTGAESKYGLSGGNYFNYVSEMQEQIRDYRTLHQ